MNFPNLTDKEFEEKFIHMIVHGKNSNTYKFAFGRFLIEYCNNEDSPTHVEFSTISSYFLKFYWPQICKTKLKHSPKYLQKDGKEKIAEIVSIIEKEFDESWYPKPYAYYEENEKQKIKNCVVEISGKNGCLKDVVWRFQKINDIENTIFFDYKVKPDWTDPNRKKTDLTYGINLNPYSMKFIKSNYFLLRTLVIFEWARFLEKFNRNEPSHVLLSLGLKEEETHSAIRIGCGRFNTDEEIQVAIDEIYSCVESLAKIRV